MNLAYPDKIMNKLIAWGTLFTFLTVNSAAFAGNSAPACSKIRAQQFGEAILSKATGEQRLLDLLGHPQSIVANRAEIDGLVKQLWQPRPVRPVIVAAGKGTRYEDSLPKNIKRHNKCVADVQGEPVVEVVLKKVLALEGNEINLLKPVVVVSKDNEDEIRKALTEYDVDYLLQHPVAGNGHAALQMRNIDKDFNGDFLIIWGTMAVVQPQTLEDAIKIKQSLPDCVAIYPCAWRKNPYAPLKTDGAIVLDSVETHLEGAETPEYGLDNIGAFVVDAQAMFEALGAYDEHYDAAAGIYKGLPGGELGLPNTLGHDLPQAGKLVISAPVADPRECQGIKIYEDTKTAEAYIEELKEKEIGLLVQQMLDSGFVSYAGPADMGEAVNITYQGNITSEEPSYKLYIKSGSGEVLRSLSMLSVAGWSQKKEKLNLHLDRVETAPQARRRGYASLLMGINEYIAENILHAKQITLKADPFTAEDFYTQDQAEEVKAKGPALRDFYEGLGYEIQNGQSWPVWNPDKSEGWSFICGYYEGQWPALAKNLTEADAAGEVGEFPGIKVINFAPQAAFARGAGESV